MGLLKEFRDFAVKGNAMDMAVGIIIGAAFSKIVTSLVNDVIMPPIGMLLGGVDFKNLQLTLKQASTSAAGEAIPAVAVRYGLFINTMIDFSDRSLHDLHGHPNAQPPCGNAPAVSPR